jgi:hypothetical protein
MVAGGGPARLIANLRQAEDADDDPIFPDKPYDDATVALCRMDPAAGY